MREADAVLRVDEAPAKLGLLLDPLLIDCMFCRLLPLTRTLGAGSITAALNLLRRFETKSSGTRTNESHRRRREYTKNIP